MTRATALLVATLSSVLLPSVAAGQDPEAPLSVIKLDRYRTRWSVDAEVGGRTRKLLLDTGGGITLLSHTVAESAGCKPWGRITGFRMFGDRGDGPHCDSIALTIAGRRYVPALVGISELGKLNPADSTLDGLIGLNAFDGQAITIDFARGTIVVESDRSLARRIRRAFGVRRAGQLVRSGGGLATGERSVAATELDHSPPAELPATHVAAGPRTRYVARLRS